MQPKEQCHIDTLSCPCPEFPMIVIELASAHFIIVIISFSRGYLTEQICLALPKSASLIFPHVSHMMLLPLMSRWMTLQ